MLGTFKRQKWLGNMSGVFFQVNPHPAGNLLFHVELSGSCIWLFSLNTVVSDPRTGEGWGCSSGVEYFPIAVHCDIAVSLPLYWRYRGQYNTQFNFVKEQLCSSQMKQLLTDISYYKVKLCYMSVLLLIYGQQHCSIFIFCIKLTRLKRSLILRCLVMTNRNRSF